MFVFCGELRRVRLCGRCYFFMSLRVCCRPEFARRRNNLQQSGDRPCIRSVPGLVRSGCAGRTTGIRMGASLLSGFSSGWRDAARLARGLSESFLLADFAAFFGGGHLACGLWCFGRHAASWAAVGDTTLFARLSAAGLAGAGVDPLLFEPALEIGSGFCFADSHYFFLLAFFAELPQFFAPTLRHFAMAPDAYADGNTLYRALTFL